MLLQAVLAGDYILGISSIMLARIGNSEVISLLARVIQDLVRGNFYFTLPPIFITSNVFSGEFMQLSTKESDAEQFQDYLNKTFCKTASLFANTCKAVDLSLLSPTSLTQQIISGGITRKYSWHWSKSIGWSSLSIRQKLRHGISAHWWSPRCYCNRRWSRKTCHCRFEIRSIHCTRSLC